MPLKDIYLILYQQLGLREQNADVPFPTEIFIQILECLPTTAALCFALTRRTFYGSFFFKMVPHIQEDRRKFASSREMFLAFTSATAA